MRRKLVVNYLMRRRGRLTSPAGEAYGFVRLPELRLPDLEVFFVPAPFFDRGSVTHTRTRSCWGRSCSSPHSRGRVSLRDSWKFAGRYTLLDHEHALQRLMPTAAAEGVDIFIGAPYNSGVLAGGIRFDYQNAPAAISAKVARITDIAQRHGVPIKAAALQFWLAHPATAAVIPGGSRPDRIAEDYAALNTKIPDDFWHEMRGQHLVAAHPPLPIDR
jgi:hypothetical protein